MKDAPGTIEEYEGFTLRSLPRKTRTGRWSVSVRIEDAQGSGRFYKAEDGISYILEEEAAKEGLNLGRNLIFRGML